MEITIKVPDDLGRRLQRFQDRLPAILEQAIHELMSEDAPQFDDENVIMELLASQPTPEQIMAIRPSPQFQERISDLLRQSKHGLVSREDEVELERYLHLEHLVRLAKIHAFERMAKTQ